MLRCNKNHVTVLVPESGKLRWPTSRAATNHYATSPGSSAPMRDIRPPRRRTSSTARTCRKGQTGLSIAFDLPTQTGYDSDHPLAKGEVGKVGVPVGHLGDMRALFDGDPARRDEHLDDHQRDGGLAARALYRGRRRAGRAARQALQGTTQNDIIKEYLSRGTYVFPPEPSMRLIKDMRSCSPRATCRNGIR